MNPEVLEKTYQNIVCLKAGHVGSVAWKDIIYELLKSFMQKKIIFVLCDHK